MIGITDTNMKLVIENLLSTYNPEKVMRTIITEYAKNSVENCQFLLKIIPDIAERLTHILEQERMEKSQAIFWMMFQRFAQEKGNEAAYFASMVPVCKTYFSNGKVEGRSLVEIDYFNHFCELFKNKKAFSWEKDKDWADSMGYTDYLRLVEKQMNEEN